MDDRAIALAAAAANQIELQARRWFASIAAADTIERNAAQAVLRQAVALRKACENTIVTRGMRAVGSN
jgi:hypothetical protein